MGCVHSSKLNNEEDLEAPDNIVIKPRPWQHDDRISSDELREMRNIFWHNIPRFGGQPDIWRALRRAAESDLPYAQAIIDENNLRLGNPDMTVVFDDTGFRYELPLYVLSEPSNMHGNAEAGPSGRSSFRYELPLYVLSEPSNMHGNAEAGPSGRSSMMDRIRRKTW
ncbi:ubiquitin domain-containing protein 1-like protein [Tanacetum coccineum]